jgi:hypothetical protein
MKLYNDGIAEQCEKIAVTEKSLDRLVMCISQNGP